MRVLKILILCFCYITSNAQTVLITGPKLVTPGSETTYTAIFPQGLDFHAIVQWNVSGGTIVQATTWGGASTFTCKVRWDQTPGVGTIDVEENLYGQNGNTSIQVGAPLLTPQIQYVNYGAVPGIIAVDVVPLDNGVNIAWEYSPNGINSWSNLSNGSGNLWYSPQANFSVTYYRCIITVNATGAVFYTDPAIVNITPLNPGIITLGTQPNYNTGAAVSNTPANGGYCYVSDYQYSWEQSVESGPWTVIGNGVSYPSNAPAIIGYTKVRRKITCNGQSLYTNIIEMAPAYSGVDAENRNYIRINTITTRGIQSWYQADQLDAGKKFQQTVYFDGLGRSIQTVNKGISSAPNNVWKDLVSFTNYDNLGRPVQNNLRYATASDPGKFKTATSEQINFFTTNYNESSPWGKTEYDNDPLGRVNKIIHPGSYRIANQIGNSFDYNFNNADGIDEKVHIWRIGYIPGTLPTTSATDVYQTGTLIKTVVTDDKGKQVIEYNDVLGNTILKKVQLKEPGAGLTTEHDGWLSTYYVYDDFKQLRFIITPKAVAYLDANNWVLTQTIADELCYYYEYDERGRVIVKKTPGVSVQSMVYDQRDQVVFTQDGNQINKEWLVDFYDDQNRLVETGKYTSVKNRDQLQTDMNMAAVASSIIVGGTPSPTSIIEVNSRPTENPPPRYVAGEEINFVESFESNNADEFVAEIEPFVPGSYTTINVVLNAQPPVNVNSGNYTALTYNYYDDYAYANAKSFSNNYNNLQAYSATDPDIEPIAATKRVRGLATGSKVRVLNTNTFLVTTVYYDENSDVIQTLSDNYKNGTDIITLQRHFAGRIMSSYSLHGMPNGAFNGFGILTKNVYDKVGRIKALQKKFGTACINQICFKQIAEYEYDELGQLKTKKLGNKPNTGDPLETLNYSYNASGQLTGINKDYVLSQNNFDQWNNYFGLYLGYENFDSKFTNARFDHLITGLMWKTQGDNTPRKYDFIYDNAGRYTAANFTQKAAPAATGWSNVNADFSESDIEYDENGNLKKLYRKGIVAGNATPLYIDRLTYEYKTVAGGQWSNQLLKVFDNNPSIGATANGKLGDFKDEVFNSNTDDYTYDTNGNLVIDNNKKIRNGTAAGITYNYLNQPEKIILENKSTVEYTYDAVGNKLAKKVTPFSGSAKTTYYIGEFVYEDQDLQYIRHEEGRLRVITNVSSTSPLGAAGQIITGNIQLTSNKWGVFDYFIKDHLGSTRMVLTEEYHKEIFKCTMEQVAAPEEERLFGQVDNNGNPVNGNEVVKTRDGKGNWGSNTSTSVSRLITNGVPGAASIGPNVLLKVMAGDLISATTNYYYQTPVSAVTNTSILNTIATSIVGGFTGSSVSQSVKDGATGVQSTLQDPSGPLLTFLNNQPAQPGDRPKAYLNYIFFDENFNYVAEKSGATPIDNNQPDYHITVPNIQAPKNGYAYVYLSNESNWEVLFDDFTVSHERGAIIEETHYYPHGLKIAGISSRAFNKLPNKYNFQGDFSEEEEESGYDEFGLRMYDPQIGRWIQSDPYDQFPSGYVGMGNDPVNNSDADGGFIENAAQIIGVSIGAATGTAIGYFIDKNNGGSGQVGALSGFLLGGGIGYGIASINWSALKINMPISTYGGEIDKITTIIKQTIVTIWGEVVYDEMNDDYYGKIKTGYEIVRQGDPGANVELHYYYYNGPLVYGGFDLKIKTELRPPFQPLQLPVPDKLDLKFTKIENDPIDSKIPRAMDNLKVDFTGGSDAIDPNNLQEVNGEIRKLAGILRRNPDMNVTLIGNGGWGPPRPGPFRNMGPASTAQGSATLNGRTTTEAVLFRARAQTIRNILINNYGISPARIATRAGSLFSNESGRYVSVTTP